VVSKLEKKMKSKDPILSKLKSYNELPLVSDKHNDPRFACYTWGCDLLEDGHYYAFQDFQVAFSIREAQIHAGPSQPIFGVLNSPTLKLRRSSTTSNRARIIDTDSPGARAIIIKQ